MRKVKTANKRLLQNQKDLTGTGDHKEGERETRNVEKQNSDTRRASIR